MDTSVKVEPLTAGHKKWLVLFYGGAGRCC